MRKYGKMKARVFAAVLAATLSLTPQADGTGLLGGDIVYAANAEGDNTIAPAGETCIGEVPVTDIRITGSKTLYPGEKVQIIMSGDWQFEHSNVSGASMNMVNDGHYMYDDFVQLQYDEASNTYQGEFLADEANPSGLWQISSVKIRFTDETYLMTTNFNQDWDTSLTVELPGKDETAPVVTEISLGSSQNSFLQIGNKVDIAIKATDDKALKETASVRFVAASEEAAAGSRNVTLTYDAARGAYVGALEVDAEMYPCEWYIKSFVVEDTAGNCFGSSVYDEGQYNRLLQDFPYYFMVKNGETYVEVTKDVTVKLGISNADNVSVGNYEKTIKQAPRRWTLRELMGEFPEITTPENLQYLRTIKGINGYSYEVPVTLDSAILCDGTTIEMRAFCSDSTEGGETPVDPEKPTEPEKPTDPEKPTEPQKPSAEIIAAAVAEISGAKSGETVEVNMDKATVVPKELLEAAKSKDVDVVFNMGVYSWTINGKDITEPKDINLEMKLDTNAVPMDVVNQIAGDAPVRQISLTHNGEFGFEAELSLNLGSENAGRFGNLFYYDATGKLVFVDAEKIGADGSVSFVFSHASDYIVVMGKDMTEDNNSNNNNNNNNNGNNNSNKNQTQTTSPKTSDMQHVSVVWAILIMAAGGAVLFAAKKKREENR